MPITSADFRHFYDKHFDRVYRFVYFRVGNNVTVAEDLTSEIFLKALSAFAHYDPAISQTSWIMTIARNHLINHWRDKKGTVDVDEVAFLIEGEDGRNTQSANDDIRTVNAALAQLPVKDRRLIEMKHVLGYRYKEIADELKKSAGAVRIETHRAMKKLKKILDPSYEET